MIVVVPPHSAERVPDSKSSAVSRPVELVWAMWQWLSMPPGSTSLPRASMTSAALLRSSARATIRPSLTPTSAAKVSAAVATVPPLTIRSNAAIAVSSRWGSLFADAADRKAGRCFQTCDATSPLSLSCSL